LGTSVSATLFRLFAERQHGPLHVCKEIERVEAMADSDDDDQTSVAGLIEDLKKAAELMRS
jgi:hypothetical protein